MNVIKYIFTRSLPKTGQATVYTAGDDGTYQKGWWKNKTIANNKVRFIDNGDDTITDRATGLMWEKIPSSSTYTWSAAIAHAEQLTLAGYTNWRLPNINELLSLINYNSYYNATYSPFFDAMQTGSYFSSTAYKEYIWFKWGIDFYIGLNAYYDITDAYYVICVRNI